MTRNRTIHTAIKQTLFVAATLAGMAWTGSAQAEDVTQVASVQTVVPARSERSFDLRDHGDRFKLALEAIRKESRTPDWGWEDCDENHKVAQIN